MKKQEIMSFEEILAAVQNLSLSEMRKLNTAYVANKNKTIDKRIDKLVTLDLQNRVMRIRKDDLVCPKCGCLNILFNGSRENGVQRLKCKDCNHQFTIFTGTMLEHSKFHYSFWISMIHMMLRNETLENIKANLEETYQCQGIHIETIFNWRHKIFNAAMNVDKPKLKSVVEIDETFFQETQVNGAMINPLNPTEKRKSRKSKKPAKYGVMSPEFANVICAIDHSGHVIAYVVGTGACSEETFSALFHEHLQEATWLCTDANGMYTNYCKKYDIAHYVRPSEYHKRLSDGLKNGRTERDMYTDELLDYIDAGGKAMYDFSIFTQIKKKLNLGLGHVNQFHSVLKQKIQARTHGVSTIHLPGYVAWECLLQNFKVDYGHAPTTQKDAEIIFEMLIKTNKNILVKEISTKKIDFSKPGKRNVNNLIEATEAVRTQNSSELHDYELTSEDVNANFNLREYLGSLPMFAIKEMGGYLKIPGWTTVKKGHTYKVMKALEAHARIDEAIAHFRAKHPTYKVEKEAKFGDFSKEKASDTF